MRNTSDAKTAAFVTLGCKVNQYETEAIREEVLELGYREVPYTEPAEVYVVNTCSVTATSGVKSRKYVQRVARTNPNARVIVVGCSTASERDALAQIPQVAVLAGNEEKTLVASFLDGGWKPGEPFPDRDRDIFSLRVHRYRDRTRANVKVQDGCNSFCSFCVIPFLRGRSRSRHPEAVLEEIRTLVDNGFQEVVITGVHLQDYGDDLECATSLEDLLTRVAAVSGLARVRMSSVNVKVLTPAVLDLLQDPVFCPHWHLPLQAGSDAVLRRMRRDYTIAEFAAVVDGLHQRFERPSIATDLIVGHPGETAEQFEETLTRCREFGFSKMHVFPYSRREGTLADKLGGHNHPLEIRERAQRARDLDAELALQYREQALGGVGDVLVERATDGASPERRNAHPANDPEGRVTRERRDTGAAPNGELEGLTRRYVRVRFPAPSQRAHERFPGTVQPVRLVELDGASVLGSWQGELSEPESAQGSAAAPDSPPAPVFPPAPVSSSSDRVADGAKGTQ